MRDGCWLCCLSMMVMELLVAKKRKGKEIHNLEESQLVRMQRKIELV